MVFLRLKLQPEGFLTLPPQTNCYLRFILFVGLNVISVLADNLETKKKGNGRFDVKRFLDLEPLSSSAADIDVKGYRPFLL